jgi:hypothetical protein
MSRELRSLSMMLQKLNKQGLKKKGQKGLNQRNWLMKKTVNLSKLQKRKRKKLPNFAVKTNDALKILFL